jgi:serine/threonine protein kinase
LLKNGLEITEEQAKVIFKQVLLAMRSIERAGVVHRDIKTANILIHVEQTNKRGGGRLSDSNCIKPLWRAGEVPDFERALDFLKYKRSKTSDN